MDAVERVLKAAVERRCGGTARLAYIDAVSARPPGRPGWDGLVMVFDLDGSPDAGRAYAWLSTVGPDDERRVHIVPHGAPVESAQDAVMAAVAGAEHARSGDRRARMPLPAHGERQTQRCRRAR